MDKVIYNSWLKIYVGKGTNIAVGIVCHGCGVEWKTGLGGTPSGFLAEVEVAANVNGWIINKERWADCPCGGCNKHYTCEDCANRWSRVRSKCKV